MKSFWNGNILGGADVDPTLNPIKQMAVTVSSDHGAVIIGMLGTIDVDEVAGQPAPGTNVTMRNQLLGVQSVLLSPQQDNVELRTAVN